MNLLLSDPKFLKLRRRLMKAVYHNDPNFKDTTTALVTMIMHPKSRFGASAEIIPIIITDERRRPIACAIFIIANKLSDTLQIAFFEALPDQPAAVTLLMNYAKEIAQFRQLIRIVIGLNGHVNNGLGFLAGPFNSPACFGSAYNPSYYIDYLAPLATTQHTLVSYIGDFQTSSMDPDRKLIERATRQFRLRTGNFKNLRSEIAIYTNLNNRCFQSHPLYSERSVDDDYELFKSFGPFLKEENFLIAEYDGQPIGFLLWYPDFHELIRAGKSIGVRTLMKYRIFKRPISRFKITEIGVLQEFQGTGVIAGLILLCCDIAKKHHLTCETGWIFDTNKKSRSIATRWISKPYKTYTAFEIDLKQGNS
ncbi:GNAT family N-acetyltransferase [candidate division KSB1 bacterium]|nr:GNAT family N-acetyltransferase [candidate division KSB1 bacterium]